MTFIPLTRQRLQVGDHQFMMSCLMPGVRNQAITKLAETGVAALLSGPMDPVFDRAGHLDPVCNVVNQEKMKQRGVLPRGAEQS
jgi:hypothetical protein